MNHENSSARTKIAAVTAGVAVAGLVAAGAGLWVFRQPAAEAALRSACAGKGLTCTGEVRKLDLSGVVIDGLSVTGVAGRKVVAASRIDIDLSWSAPWAPAARMVTATGLALHLDATGKGPLLGGLEAFSDGKRSGGPMPAFIARDIAIIADTPAGPVRATAQVEATAADSLTASLVAPAASLTYEGSRIVVDGLSANLVIAGADIRGDAAFGLRTAALAGGELGATRGRLTFAQAASGLTAEGSFDTDSFALADIALAAGKATLKLDADPIPGGAVTPDTLIPALRRLTLVGEAGGGRMGQSAWQGLSLNVDLAPEQSGEVAGPASLVVRQPENALGGAGALSLDARVRIAADAPAEGSTPAMRRMSLTGAARVEQGRLSGEGEKALDAALARAAGTPLEPFAAGLARVLRKAGGAFDVSAPWSAIIDQGGLASARLFGAELVSRSGLKAKIEGGQPPQPDESDHSFLTLEGGKVIRASAAGAASLSGGGGPVMEARLERLEAGPDGLELAGEVSSAAWRTGADTTAFSLRNAGLTITEGRLRAEGEVDVAFTGPFAGGRWTGGRLDARLDLAQSPEGFEITARDPVRFSWREGRYADARIAAGRLAYAPEGPLARLSADGADGKGRLAALAFDVSGPGYSANPRAPGALVDWRLADVRRIRITPQKLRSAFSVGGQAGVLEAPTAVFTIDLDKGWRIGGTLAGSARAEQVAVDRYAARLALSGNGASLSGRLEQLDVHVRDEAADRRFEPLDARLAGRLDDGVATFSARLTNTATGVQLGDLAGRHVIATGVGHVDLAPTPLIFAPDGLKPGDISPRLRGPANVAGRVDLSGGARWDREGVAARAKVRLDRLGFALASAGIFENVSGEIEVSDLLGLRSAPGQRLTIGKATQGLSIENGEVRFQLDGFDGVKIEDARWPFAGGWLRVAPMRFSFAGSGADAGNTVVALAENWDIASLIDYFKAPDIAAEGRVSGRFPVVFSTGSARIDHAVLEASEQGGVVRYTGSTGDAAAATDANAKLLFDALRDFRYRVLRLELDGNLAGKMVLSLKLEGYNPEVLDGSPFRIGIAIDSELMKLANTLNQGSSAVEEMLKDAKLRRD